MREYENENKGADTMTTLRREILGRYHTRLVPITSPVEIEGDVWWELYRDARYLGEMVRTKGGIVFYVTRRLTYFIPTDLRCVKEAYFLLAEAPVQDDDENENEND